MVELKRIVNSDERANGLAHLPPDLARQENLKTTFSTNWPPHTRAEGGQLEPVLASLAIACS